MRTSESRLWSLMDAALVGISWANTDTEEITYVNPTFTKLFGYTLKDIPNIKQWFTTACPDILYKKGLMQTRAQEYKTGGKKQQINVMTQKIRCKDGTIRYASVVISYVDSQLLSIFTDTTEQIFMEDALRSSEEKYRVLTENAYESIVVVQDGIHKYVNPKCCEMMGYTSHEMISRPYNHFIFPGDKEMVAAIYQKRLKGEDVPANYQFRLVTKSGNIRWVDLSAATITWESMPAALYFLTDITERKAAEDALRSNEAMLRTIMDTAPTGITWADFQTKTIQYINNQFTDLFGYTLEDIPKLDIWFEKAFPDPEYREYIKSRRNLDKQDRKAGVIHTPEETMIRCKDGSTRYALVATTMVNDVHALAVFSDMTKLKSAEETLRKNEEMLNRLLINAPIAFSRSDIKSGKLVTVNRRFTELFGYTAEDVPTIDIWMCRAFPDEDYRKHMLDRRKMKNNSYDETATSTPMETRITCKDGSVKYCIVAGTVVSDQMLVAYNDISERKQMEEQINNQIAILDRVGDSFSSPMFSVDNSYRYTSFNNHQKRGMKTIYGADIQIGANALDYYPNDESRKKVKEHIDHALNGESLTFEESVVDASGNRSYYEILHNPITNLEGQIIGAVVFVANITERKRIETERIQNHKLEAVGKLAGGIAHDFNNILTALLGNISLARMPSTSKEELQELLDEAESASIRAKDLTQQLLTFARGGAPVKRTASISELIKDTVVFVLRGSNIVPELSIADDLYYADIDVGQISQVINNLTLNAKEAMPNGGRIRIKAENTYLHQGIGIPEENLQRIFDPYFTTKQTGSGLGLATSYSIIKNHQGMITVSSKLGTGTTFTIYLPGTKNQVTPQAASEIKYDIKQFKILLMDDEKPILSMLTRMLQKIGHEEIVPSQEGGEAVELFKQAMDSGKPFDLVILDLTIPGGLGGKETMEQLLRIDPNIKVIVSSGYSIDPVLSNHLNYGFKGSISKPYTTDKLKQVLSDVMKA